MVLPATTGAEIGRLPDVTQEDKHAGTIRYTLISNSKLWDTRSPGKRKKYVCFLIRVALHF